VERLSAFTAPYLARRSLVLLPLLVTLGLVACSDDGPEKTEALDQINRQLLDTLPQGEQRVQNLVFVSGGAVDGGYEIFVDYDLVSTMPSVGLFSTVSKAGDRQHVGGERFLFVKGAKGWQIQ
jgi:hypothetical protein